MDETRLHLRPPVWLPILVVLIAGGSYITGKMVETRHIDQPSISVNGVGEVHAIPDIGLLQFGVETKRYTSSDGAMRDLARRMEAIMEAVLEEGVEEKDIKTRHLSLRPSYDWVEGKRTDEGFEASQSLEVRVRDTETISSVLDAAVTAGANQAGNVRFIIDDTDALRAEAREMAIQDAKEKAKVLAEQLGTQLGPLTGFWEESGGHDYPVMERAMALDSAGIGGASTPLPAGEQEISVKVNLTYRIR